VLARTIVESEEKCIDIRTALVFSEFENGKLQMQLHLHFRQIYLEEIECIGKLSHRTSKASECLRDLTPPWPSATMLESKYTTNAWQLKHLRVH
jgi:hypothetical protein